MVGIVKLCVDDEKLVSNTGVKNGGQTNNTYDHRVFK